MKNITITIDNINDYSELISNVNYTRLYDALDIVKKNFPDLNICITKQYEDGTGCSHVLK